eukprot:scaffold269741_cov47-Prasinocladus_malaysianus.AAC.1
MMDVSLAAERDAKDSPEGVEIITNESVGFIAFLCLGKVRDLVRAGATDTNRLLTSEPSTIK